MGLEAKRQQIPLFRPSISYSDKNLDTSSNVYQYGSQDHIHKDRTVKFSALHHIGFQFSLFEEIYRYYQLIKCRQREYFDLVFLTDQRFDRKGSTRLISKYDNWPTIHFKTRTQRETAWGPT